METSAKHVGLAVGF